MITKRRLVKAATFFLLLLYVAMSGRTKKVLRDKGFILCVIPASEKEKKAVNLLDLAFFP